MTTDERTIRYWDSKLLEPEAVLISEEQLMQSMSDIESLTKHDGEDESDRLIIM